MENQLKQVCLCIQQVAAIEDTISANRLSPAEVAAVMELVDLKRRGFLDLNDIYELVGKVTEAELFAVFKHLDRSRTGEVRVPDLQTALGNSQLTSSNTTKEYLFPRFYKMVDTIKDRPKLTREAVKQHSLTASGLKSAYQYLCELVQSKYLSQEELVTILKTQFIKNGLRWTSYCEGVVQELLPGQNVSEARFIEAFSAKSVQEDCEEECLLKGISDAPATSTFEKN
jgi:Ca2+-binding EF-hand superfamily protein